MTRFKALRTTVVGCGAVAQKLYRKPLQALQRQGFLRVTGLVDRTASHAQAMHSAFPRAATFEHLEEALATIESDLTLILTPIQLHAAQSVLALRRGNHVLCEKPMAVTEAQCVEMIDAARVSDRVLAVGMIR